MPKWTLFADRNLIRLNQAPIEGAGADAAADKAAEVTGDAATDKADKAAEAPETPSTLEEALAALEKANADLEAQKRVNRSLDRRTKADKKRIDSLMAQGKTLEQAESEVDAANSGSATDAAVQSAQQAAKTQYNLKLAQANAKAALAGKVQDPDYAVWLLRNELPDVPVSDEGDVDQHALTDLVEDLLDKNPQLKVTQGALGGGSADQGARKADARTAVERLDEQIAQAEKARNFTLSVNLKQQRAALLVNQKKG